MKTIRAIRLFHPLVIGPIPETATSALSVLPTQVVASTGGNTLSLTGVNTTWTPGNPGTPTFTVSSGTILAQIVDTATTARLTFTAPASGTVTVTDPSTGKTATVTIPSAGTGGNNAGIRTGGRM